MDSRAAILAALGGAGPPAVPPPGYVGPTLRFEEPEAAFRDALTAAGARLRTFADWSALRAALAEAVGRAQSVVSRVEELARALGEADPSEAAPELAVLSGGPAVAESGAVWWVPHDDAERRAAFLAERVILVVPRAALVHELHAAYRCIDPAAASFGCFVSGPSKTADIEQALVIGAHGPRALDVYLWG